jgi:segregation and condensation protein A
VLNLELKSSLMNHYTIKLKQFEGPFDLLLFFIERDELDVYDIPIAKITEDFLAYIREMEALNIDLASEFILVAASLMRIKAKLLLPRKELDEAGNEIDPRDELVQKILEYKRYKAILDDMKALELDRSLKNSRGNISKELKTIANKAMVDAELESLTMFKLLKAFERVMEEKDKRDNKVVHKIYQHNYTIKDQQDYIYSKINVGQQTSFKDLFVAIENRMHAIVTFLALLELLNLQMVKATIGEGRNNFWLSL